MLSKMTSFFVNHATGVGDHLPGAQGAQRPGRGGPLWLFTRGVGKHLSDNLPWGVPVLDREPGLPGGSDFSRLLGFYPPGQITECGVSA